jgi:hypothetical protein
MYEGDVNEFIAHMEKVIYEDSVDEYVRQLAERAVASFTPNFYVRAVYNFCKIFPYVSDPTSGELLTTPHVIARDYLNEGIIHGLDCDCVSTLICCMLNSIGIKSRVAILATGGSEFDHAIAQTWSDTLQMWINIDVTTKQLSFGWELNSNRTKYIGGN